MSKTTNHIIARQKDLSAHCLHCGAILKMELPVDLDVYLASNKAFIKVHKRCKQRA